MSHLEAAKRYLEARRRGLTAKNGRPYELDELTPTILAFPVEEPPRPLAWEALSTLRWGPSLEHDLPGLDVGRDRPLRPI